MTGNAPPATDSPVIGFVAPGLEPVQNQFEIYLRSDPSYSAQLAIYRNGELIVDLVGGPDTTADSLTGVFSVTKGVAAIALATLVEDGILDLNERVVHYWPEFAPHSKESLTVAELLSHRAGLVNIEGGMDSHDLLIDTRAGAKLLAAARPLWRPGTSFGYHALTIGVFMEELTRRITGESLQYLYEQRVRAPRNIDFFLGLPESQEPRFRPLLPMQPPAAQLEEQSASPASPDGYGALAMNCLSSQADLISGPISPNQHEVRTAGSSALGGVGSARGLAAVYGAALGSKGSPLLSPETIGAMTQQQSWGRDRVLNIDASFATVFQTPVPGRLDFGSYRAFGHDGAGGAMGYADPTYDLAFGYIPAAMQFPGGADPKCMYLSQLVRECLTGRVRSAA